MKKFKKILLMAVVTFGVQSSAFAMSKALNLRKLLSSTCALATSAFIQNVSMADQVQAVDKKQILREYKRRLDCSDKVRALCLNDKVCSAKIDDTTAAMYNVHTKAHSFQEWRRVHDKDLDCMRRHLGEPNLELQVIDDERCFSCVQKIAREIGLDYTPRVYTIPYRLFRQQAIAFTMAGFIVLADQQFAGDYHFMLRHEMMHILNNDVIVENISNEFYKDLTVAALDDLMNRINSIGSEIWQELNYYSRHIDQYIVDLKRKKLKVDGLIQNFGSEVEMEAYDKRFNAVIDQLKLFKDINGKKQCKTMLDSWKDIAEDYYVTALELVEGIEKMTSFACERRADEGALHKMICPDCVRQAALGVKGIPAYLCNDKGYFSFDDYQKYAQQLEQEGKARCCEKHSSK